MVAAAFPLVRLLMQKTRGAVAKAQLMELVNDESGLLAAFTGTLFIMWGYPVADPVAAIIVATIIAINAVRLFRENLDFLIGRSPDPDVLAEIASIARSVEGVLDVHELRAEYVGQDMLHIGMHITVKRGIPVEAADQIVDEVDERVHQFMKESYCFIHIDPENTMR